MRFSYEVLLLLSIPQTFAVTWFVFRLYGVTVKRFFRRTWWFTATGSVLLNIGFLTLRVEIHLIVSIALMFVLLHLFYRELRWRTKLLLLATFYVCAFISDIVALALLSDLVPYETLRTGPFYYKFLLWPFFGAFAAGAAVMERRRCHPAARLAGYIGEVGDTHALSFLLLLVFQLIVLSTSFVLPNLLDRPVYSDALFAIGIVSVLTVTAMAARLIVCSRRRAIRLAQSVYVDELLRLFASSRSHKQDFTAYVRTMQAMLKQGKTKDLAAYMEEVVDGIRIVSEQTAAKAIPELAAVIYAKQAAAADNRIEFEVRIPALPAQELSVRTIELVGMTRKLLEHAYERVILLPYNSRKMTLDIYGEETHLIIRVGSPPSTKAVVPVKVSERYVDVVRKQAKRCRGDLSVALRADGGTDYCLRLPLASPVTAP